MRKYIYISLFFLSTSALFGKASSSLPLFQERTTIPQEKFTPSFIGVSIFPYAQAAYHFPGAGLSVRHRLENYSHILEVDASALILLPRKNFYAIKLSGCDLFLPFPSNVYFRYGIGITAMSCTYFNIAFFRPYVPLFVGYQGARGFADVGFDLIIPMWQVRTVPTIRLGISF